MSLSILDTDQFRLLDSYFVFSNHLRGLVANLFFLDSKRLIKSGSESARLDTSGLVGVLSHSSIDFADLKLVGSRHDESQGPLQEAIVVDKECAVLLV